MRRESGTTLIEVLIAVTLLSLLSVGMLTAMRVGFMAFSKTNTRLMENRRAAGAQQFDLRGARPYQGEFHEHEEPVQEDQHERDQALDDRE